jgi:hypothetical protein
MATTPELDGQASLRVGRTDMYLEQRLPIQPRSGPHWSETGMLICLGRKHRTHQEFRPQATSVGQTEVAWPGEYKGLTSQLLPERGEVNSESSCRNLRSTRDLDWYTLAIEMPIRSADSAPVMPSTAVIQNADHVLGANSDCTATITFRAMAARAESPRIVESMTCSMSFSCRSASVPPIPAGCLFCRR